MNIDDDIVKHYESGVESSRLFVGVSQLERERTKEIILRYLDKAPSKILDVGGATQGIQVDRCVLYICRSSVYFAETENPDPELLKWWNWKDKN